MKPFPLAMDWMMPGMTGVEICKRLSQKEGSQLSNVILVTARDNPTDVTEGLEAGANDYLTKPFNKAELRTRLRAGKLSGMRPDMKVLYLSGYADNIIIPHGVLESEIAFLPKSFTPDELLQ
jgi:CheY-like chemotaxis protein